MRRAQAATEYLFMVALALIMVVMVVWAILKVVRAGTSSLDNLSRRLQDELQNMITPTGHY